MFRVTRAAACACRAATAQTFATLPTFDSRGISHVRRILVAARGAQGPVCGHGSGVDGMPVRSTPAAATRIGSSRGIVVSGSSVKQSSGCTAHCRGAGTTSASASGVVHASGDLWAPVASFADVGVAGAVVDALRKAGFERPTTVQAMTIPEVLTGRDAIITAETGSGKTLAYLVPVIEDLLRDAVSRGVPLDGSGESAPLAIGDEWYRPRGLVLVPTQELVLQVCAVASELLGPLSYLVQPAYARFGPSPKAHCGLLVGTPKALETNVRPAMLQSLATLVVDEADMLMAGSSAESVTTMLMAMKRLDPSQRPLHIFCGATMPDHAKKSVGKWLQKYYPEAALIRTPRLHDINRNCVQRFVTAVLPDGVSAETEDPATVFELLLSGRRRALLEALPHSARGSDGADATSESPPTHSYVVGSGKMARNTALSPDDVPKTLVFVSSRGSAEATAEYLSDAAPMLRLAMLHNKVSGAARERVLAQFAEDGPDSTQVLVCTDIAARGIDTVHVVHVIQFDFATDAVTYLHRCGRTARAGTHGVVTNIVEAGSTSESLASALRAAAESGEGLEATFSRRRSFRKNVKRRAARGYDGAAIAGAPDA